MLFCPLILKEGYGNWLAAWANSWRENMGSEWEWVRNDRAVPSVTNAYGVRKLWGFLCACNLLQCWWQQTVRSTFFMVRTQGCSSFLVFSWMYCAKPFISRWCSSGTLRSFYSLDDFWPCGYQQSGLEDLAWLSDYRALFSRVSKGTIPPLKTQLLYTYFSLTLSPFPLVLKTQRIIILIQFWT